MEECNSCLNCKKCDQLLLQNQRKFCKFYPDRMTLINKDIIGVYVCGKYDELKASDVYEPSLKKLMKRVPEMYGGKSSDMASLMPKGTTMIGMIPIPPEIDSMDKMMDYLKRLGFFR